MKQLLLLAVGILSFSIGSLAQTPETFDIATFHSPENWIRETTQSSVRFSIEDRTTGAYCMITLLKGMPSTNNPSEDFDAAWQKIVKGLAKVSAAPEMGEKTNDNGWEIQTGFAPFDNDGAKGIAMLVTASGFSKMVNVVVLTNTQAYQQNVTDFLGSISLTKPAAAVVSTPVRNSPPVPSSAVSSGYTFTTTNFDDGWVSTIQEDWVQVTKGNIKVLIHHPNKNADAYHSVVLDGLKKAWDVLVAPRYSRASNFEFKPITGWQAIEFAEADLSEQATGKTVHVALFKMNYSNGTGRYMEFITPNKAVFEQEFGPYHQTTSGWEKMEKVATLNKFSVAAADLKGKWTNDFSGSLSFVNAYTGANAGTDTHASIENFQFGSGNSYTWDIGVASGYVGSIKFQSVKSSGKFTVPNNWKVSFSDIQGRARTYDAYFSAVKGSRILWLDGKPFGKIQ